MGYRCGRFGRAGVMSVRPRLSGWARVSIGRARAERTAPADSSAPNTVPRAILSALNMRNVLTRDLRVAHNTSRPNRGREKERETMNQNDDLIDRRVRFRDQHGKWYVGEVIAENVRMFTTEMSPSVNGYVVVKDDSGRCWGVAARHVSVVNPNYYADVDNPALCEHCWHPCHSDDAATDGNVSLCGSLRGNGCADRAVWRGDVIVGIDGKEW